MKINDVVNFGYMEKPDQDAIYQALKQLFLLGAIQYLTIIKIYKYIKKSYINVIYIYKYVYYYINVNIINIYMKAMTVRFLVWARR